MTRNIARTLTLSVMGIALMAAARPSEAQTTLCFKLDPFVDTLRVTIVAHPNSMFGSFVRWRASNLYQFQGAGLLSPDPTVANDFRLAFSAAGNTSNFSCDFQGLIAAGTWSFQCPSTGFTNSGTLTFLPTCPATAAPTEDGPSAMPKN